MKKQFFRLITLAILILSACCKKEQNEDYQTSKKPLLQKTLKGGCFIGKTANFSSDTTYYELKNDTLLFHITINKNCSSNPADSVAINHGDINIFIRDQFASNAYCNCDYQFTYQFTNFNTIQYFKIYNKDNVSANYILWNTLIFP